VFTSALVLLALLPAQPTPSVSEIRAEARALLQSVCGWQCDIVDVRIKPKAAASVGTVLPGFDDTPAARSVPGSVDVTVLLDSALAPTFRAFAVERVRSRIGEMGLPVTVTERVVPFPPRPSPQISDPPQPALAPPSAVAPQTGQPPPTIVFPPAPPPPPAPERPAMSERLLDRLIEALPLLFLAGLLAWTVLQVLNRYENLITTDELPPPVAQATPPVVVTPVDAVALGRAFTERRAGTRRIFDRLLRAGDDELVARAVARFGPELLADLAADPAHSMSLTRAGRRAAELLRAAPGPTEDADALRALEAEVVADRIAHPVESVPAVLEPLLALGPEGFASLADRMGGRGRLILLKHGPAELATAYLAGAAPELRTALARDIALAPPAETAELEELARAMAEATPSATLAGSESARLADLLDALPAADQDVLVAALTKARPELVRRAGGRLPIEAALLQVPDSALTRAFDAVPLAMWATYLRGAPDAIRARALAACPARLSEALTEELGLRVAPPPAAVAAARRAIVRAALDAQSVLANGATARHAAGGGPPP